MKIVFEDLRRDCRFMVDGVTRIKTSSWMVKGRKTRFWALQLASGEKRAYPQKDYRPHVIEEGNR